MLRLCALGLGSPELFNLDLTIVGDSSVGGGWGFFYSAVAHQPQVSLTDHTECQTYPLEDKSAQTIDALIALHRPSCSTVLSRRNDAVPDHLASGAETGCAARPTLDDGFGGGLRHGCVASSLQNISAVLFFLPIEVYIYTVLR